MSGTEENGVGFLETFDESEAVETEEVVVIHDGESERHCIVLAVAEMNGEEFAMLAPQDQLTDGEDDDEEGNLELFLFRYRVDEKGHEVFEGIEDDALFEHVRDFFATLIDTDEEQSD